MIAIVCGVSDLARLAAEYSPTHVVSLLDPGWSVDTPASVDPAHHLRLDLYDITRPTEGMTIPDRASIERLVAFIRIWTGPEPILLHCRAGISCSTAAAFILACERNPEVDEMHIALGLRAAAPHALPNSRIVALADGLLGRRGKMLSALDSMGPHDPSRTGPFELQIRH